eukprot:1757434-Rhodomonas_salina.2
MSGTDIAHAQCPQLPQVVSPPYRPTLSLRDVRLCIVPYVMSGTDMGYAATRNACMHLSSALAAAPDPFKVDAVSVPDIA